MQLQFFYAVMLQDFCAETPLAFATSMCPGRTTSHTPCWLDLLLCLWHLPQTIHELALEQLGQANHVENL